MDNDKYYRRKKNRIRIFSEERFDTVVKEYNAE
jgi:uncharacterized protein (UPF0303 family)